MKTCETCKWYQIKRMDDYGLCYVKPPVALIDDERGARVRCFNLCSKWESKLEIKCKHCEFFRLIDKSEEYGRCHRKSPTYVVGLVHASFPKVHESDFCGEFRGRE